MPDKKTGVDAPAMNASVPDNDSPHELEFTAAVAGWMSLAIENDPRLPFSAVKCERRSVGAEQRRDLTLIGRDGKPSITGEVKLPYMKDGSTPYNVHVIKDAHDKALRAGVPYFFTWNVNECVLWKTETTIDDPAAGQHYQSWKVIILAKGSQLSLPATEDTIKRWLGQFVNDLARILVGSLKVGFKTPDERFIEALESALTLPISFTLEELTKRHESPRAAEELNKWMRDEQGWTLSTDPDAILDTLERAARFSCYAQVNRLVFYEALMKRYGARLPKLAVPEHIATGDDLRLHLEGFFAHAREVTGDYETVFGEDRSSPGSHIPFYSDSATAYWRGLINQIHEFDFSRLDYEIIGQIFERLISPEERHKFGQFYTRAEVVDLVNSFCIRSGSESLIDPACGGGTFLVRAYARKRVLAPERSHVQVLSELFGLDISQFATHLTTINLATRDLIQDENYPRVARADFFNVRTEQRFIRLPVKVEARGLGKTQLREISIPLLDAVVGNPPYVRQEDIEADKQKGPGHPLPGTKEFYRKLARDEMHAVLSGRSDLHCYFWPHAATFLKPDGWLGFLTSSQWLDVEYGFHLQQWILAHFRIAAIIESVDEPWFVGARVATTVTILQRCAEFGQRSANIVRFVQLRRPISQIMANDGTTAAAIRAADEFRDEILALDANTANERYRVRLVRQGALLTEGIALGRLMLAGGESGFDDTEDEAERTELQAGTYYGGKWGIYVRAPDLWFELLDRLGNQFVPLGYLANIRFGVKSGKDEFFFPRDVSEKCLLEIIDAAQFELEYGVPRKLVEAGRVKLVRCGEGYDEIKPLEAEYLEPEVHSLMEVTGYTVKPGDCSRMILLVGKTTEELQDSYVLKYIEWGESNGWHQGATCASRVTPDRSWYDLTGHRRGALFWPKSQQYKHSAPANDHHLQANCNLYDITPNEGVDADILGGILNSSWAVLAKFQYGRPVGNEANLKTEVVDVTMMPVADPRTAPRNLQLNVAEAFYALKGREAHQFLSEQRMRQMAFTKDGRESELSTLRASSELDMPDRRKLDSAVLEMIGVKDEQDREALISRLYDHLAEFFERARQKEEKAIGNKNKSRRRSTISAQQIAVQILSAMKEKAGRFLLPYSAYVDLERPFSTFDLPHEGEAEVHQDMFAAEGSVRFMKGRKQRGLVVTKNPKQAELVAFLATHGVRGVVRIPLEPTECDVVMGQYGKALEGRNSLMRALIEERTADLVLQEAVLAAANDLILRAAPKT